MALSIHDNLLISYEVQCEARTILLRTKSRTKNQPTEFMNVMFDGVQGYCFENDAFGNIIFGLETLAVNQFLMEYGAGIFNSTRWQDRLGRGQQILRLRRYICEPKKFRHLFCLSSFGLSGLDSCPSNDHVPRRGTCPVSVNQDFAKKFQLFSAALP